MQRPPSALPPIQAGFTQAMLRDPQAMLEARGRATSPFDQPVPREYAAEPTGSNPTSSARSNIGTLTRQWTRPDNRLRHPSWRRLRSDRSPDEVKAPFVE